MNHFTNFINLLNQNSKKGSKYFLLRNYNKLVVNCCDALYRAGYIQFYTIKESGLFVFIKKSHKVRNNFALKGVSKPSHKVYTNKSNVKLPILGSIIISNNRGVDIISQFDNKKKAYGLVLGYII